LVFRFATTAPSRSFTVNELGAAFSTWGRGRRSLPCEVRKALAEDWALNLAYYDEALAPLPCGSGLRVNPGARVLGGRLLFTSEGEPNILWLSPAQRRFLTVLLKTNDLEKACLAVAASVTPRRLTAWVRRWTALGLLS
jgi:hypothetical protein